jgi:membrane-associated phospholipid phosphatase
VSERGFRRPSRLRPWLTTVAVLAWIAFAGITLVVVAHPEGTALDLALAPPLTQIAQDGTSIALLGRALDVIGGDVVAVLTVAVVATVLVLHRHRLLATYLVVSALGFLVNTGVKLLVDRPRPPTVGLLLQESTWSYPSGHATSGITVVAALGVVALVALRSRWRWGVALPLFVLAPLIGVSRVVMGVHWPTDVLGGWALGTAWTTTVALAIVLDEHRRHGDRQRSHGENDDDDEHGARAEEGHGPILPAR